MSSRNAVEQLIAKAGMAAYPHEAVNFAAAARDAAQALSMLHEMDVEARKFGRAETDIAKRAESIHTGGRAGHEMPNKNNLDVTQRQHRD